MWYGFLTSRSESRAWDVRVKILVRGSQKNDETYSFDRFNTKSENGKGSVTYQYYPLRVYLCESLVYFLTLLTTFYATQILSPSSTSCIMQMAKQNKKKKNVSWHFDVDANDFCLFFWHNFRIMETELNQYTHGNRKRFIDFDYFILKLKLNLLNKFHLLIIVKRTLLTRPT